MIPASQSRLVSIVIPCHNAARFLAETLESALVQTHQYCEIIVIDDGSTDGSANLLRGFGNRIRVEFGPNRGASAARNSGTALATGAYIQYLDADDLLVPDAIEKRVAALRDSGADVAYGDWQRFETAADGTRNLGEIVARRIEDVDLDPEIACATTFWAPPAAILYRRRVVDAIGGWNQRLPVIQDARFLFDAAHNGGRFVHVPGVSAHYRVNCGSLSRRNERQFVLDVYHNACEIQTLWQAEGPLPVKRKNALASIYDYVARELFRSGASDFKEAASRYNALTSRRIGYPSVALRLTSLLGHDLAGIVLDGASRITRALRRSAGPS